MTYIQDIWQAATTVLATQPTFAPIDIINELHRTGRRHRKPDVVRCQIAMYCVNAHPSHDDYPDKGENWKRDPIFIKVRRGVYRFYSPATDQAVYDQEVARDGGVHRIPAAGPGKRRRVPRRGRQYQPDLADLVCLDRTKGCFNPVQTCGLPSMVVTDERPPAMPPGITYEEFLDRLLGNKEDVRTDGVLGMYCPHEETIVLFEEAIRVLARMRAWKEADLRRVVLIHEYVHWITHKLPVAGSTEWPLDAYGSTKPPVHEGWAEIGTLWTTKGNTLLEEIRVALLVGLDDGSPCLSHERLRRKAFSGAVARSLAAVRKVKPSATFERWEELIELELTPDDLEDPDTLAEII